MIIKFEQCEGGILVNEITFRGRNNRHMEGFYFPNTTLEQAKAYYHKKLMMSYIIKEKSATEWSVRYNP